MAGNHTLYGLNPLKFIKAYFMASHMVCLGECSLCIAENVYSGVLGMESSSVRPIWSSHIIFVDLLISPSMQSGMLKYATIIELSIST